MIEILINIIENYQLNVNFETAYGKEFKFLNNLKPKSILLAEGSEISVGNKRIIKNLSFS